MYGTGVVVEVDVPVWISTIPEVGDGVLTATETGTVVGVGLHETIRIEIMSKEKIFFIVYLNGQMSSGSYLRL